MDLALTIFFGLLGLNLIILIHELGHFIAAKLCGVGVETFSLGWGKKLVGFTFRGTAYQLAMFPIGGYCKLKGELFKPDFTEEDWEKAKTDKNSFMGESLWKKLTIVLAGPFASFIFAIIAFAATYGIGFNIPTPGNRIMLSSETSSSPAEKTLPANEAGLLTGDYILSINGTPTDTYHAISEIIPKTKKNETLVLRIKRGYEVLVKTVRPSYDPAQGKNIIGITPWIEPVVDRIREGKAGAEAGLKKGDMIRLAYIPPPGWADGSYVSAYGLYTLSIRNSYDFAKVLAKKPFLVSMVVSRDGATVPLSMHLTYDKSGKTKLGFDFERIALRSPSLDFFGSIAKGADQTFGLIVSIIKGFGMLFSIKITGINDVVAGPVQITMMMGEQALEGFSMGFGEGLIQFVQFINIIGVFISFMNLLPIPALDGGQAVLSVIMAVRKRTSLKFVYRYQMVGFVFIFALIVLAIASDVFKYL